MTRARVSRLLLAAIGAASPLTAGCLIPYAYPKLDYVPGAAFAPNGSDVHAFRVDASADQLDLGESGTSFGLKPIELRPDGRLPGQIALSLERGVYVAGVAVNYNVGRVHTTRVRLYRPGYQLVEVSAWGSSGPVVWTPATDWAAQEKAIDDLLRRPSVSASAAALAKNNGSFWGAATEAAELRGILSDSSEVPPAHAFAAGEYRRVAELAPTPKDADRLREKARLLVEYEPLTRTGSAGQASTNPTR